MATVTIRELRKHWGELIDRVAAGEHFTVTRYGKPVAELRPLRTPAPAAAVPLDRRRSLPALDSDALRPNVDSTLAPDA